MESTQDPDAHGAITCPCEKNSSDWPFFPGAKSANEPNALTRKDQKSLRLRARRLLKTSESPGRILTNGFNRNTEAGPTRTGGASMKKLTMFVCLLAFGVVVAFTAFRPLNAQTEATISAANSALPAAEANAAKSFAGRISLMDGKYVLVSATETFQLDDQEKAKAFDGQNVSVTGTLDDATKTIHVAEIKAA